MRKIEHITDLIGFFFENSFFLGGGFIDLTQYELFIIIYLFFFLVCLLWIGIKKVIDWLIDLEH